MTLEEILKVTPHQTLAALALLGLSACGQGDVSQSVADDISAGLEASETEIESDTEDPNE